MDGWKSWGGGGGGAGGGGPCAARPLQAPTAATTTRVAPPFTCLPGWAARPLQAPTAAPTTRVAPPATCLCSYEVPNDPDFRSTRLSLLDRGVTFAIAHVRGGGELGRRWYEDGKLKLVSGGWAGTSAAG